MESATKKRAREDREMAAISRRLERQRVEDERGYTGHRERGYGDNDASESIAWKKGRES